MLVAWNPNYTHAFRTVLAFFAYIFARTAMPSRREIGLAAIAPVAIAVFKSCFTHATGGHVQIRQDQTASAAIDLALQTPNFCDTLAIVAADQTNPTLVVSDTLGYGDRRTMLV